VSSSSWAKKVSEVFIHELCELRMRFLFRVTRHSAFVRISINTLQGFPYSAHNLLETRQFRPQLGEFFRLFREVILEATNPMRQIAEFFGWHFGMALFRARSGRSSRVLLVTNYHQLVIQNENYQRRQRNRQSLRVLMRLDHVASFRYLKAALFFLGAAFPFPGRHFSKTTREEARV
jgi:hypothetical protein